MSKDITKLFCLIDDFCKDIEKNFADKLLPNPSCGLINTVKSRNTGLFRLHRI